MARKKKQEITDLEPGTADEGKSKIPFEHWFDKQVKSGRLRYHQDEALMVFFKKQGLKNLEDEDTYNRALERF